MSDFKLSDLAMVILAEKSKWWAKNNFEPTEVFLPRWMFMKTLSYYNSDSRMPEIAVLNLETEILQLKVVFVEGLTEIKVGVIG